MLGLARVAAAGLIWGTIPLIIRYADGASVIKVFFRVFFAALVVGAWMLVSGRWRELTRLPARKWRQLSAQGLILTLNWVLFLTALDLTNVATAELLAYTSPVFVAALAPFVTREPFDRRVVVPLALALGGIVVILAPQGLAVSSPSEALGALLAFTSAITYAALLLRSKKILPGVSSGALMLVEYTLASLVLSPFVAAAYARGDAPSSASAYAALVVLGVVHTAIAGFIFLGGMRRVRTDHVAVLTYVEPVSAILFAALALDEPLTAAMLAGGALVVGGGIQIARLEARDGVETLPIEAPDTTHAGITDLRNGDTPSEAEKGDPS
jgi:drug/metabolite transporter (DMT)-like permease